MKRKTLALALLLAISGCSRTAYVSLMTDSQGKLVSASITESTGNPNLDRQAIYEARKRFPRAVPKPVANRKYVQPVIIELPGLGL